ncbi:MAG TPA: hypothetical protein PLQ20_01550 [Candidatus Paceibacterota bacterium]|nr:hypothetical protein [Candidatus Paceibacterota bacterium]
MVLLLGIAGLILVSLGLIVKSRKLRDLLSFLGGGFLLVYSIYKNDSVFIVLQSFYVLVTIFDYLKQK